jgi:hypothetical protein
MGLGSPAYSYSATDVTEPRARLILLRKTLSNRLRRLTYATFESFIDLGKTLMGTSPRRGRLEILITMHLIPWVGGMN